MKNLFNCGVAVGRGLSGSVACALLLLAMLQFQRPALFAQGSLTPPGAPAPTMKTLAQIEPRIAITNSGPVTISTSGSYYLTTNITTSSNGVVITTANVTLDLNGFTITSTAANYSGFGIRLSGSPRNITIFNGHIIGGITYSNGVYVGGGFVFAIGKDLDSPMNILVRDVSVSGCLEGIKLDSGASTVVESCTLENIKGRGIEASTVSRCSVFRSGVDAITGETVSDCSGYATGSGHGIRATLANNCKGTSTGTGNGVTAETANNCRGITVYGSGLSVTVATDCHGTATSTITEGVGITVAVGGKLSGSTGVNSAYGINAAAGSTINDCTAYNNGTGITTQGGCVVSRCSVLDNYLGIVSPRSTVKDCAAYSNVGGISGGDGSTITGCTARFNDSHGIEVSSDCHVEKNNCSENGVVAGAGIQVYGSDNRIDSNNVTHNDRGITVTGTGNLIIRNSVSSCTPNYDIGTNNHYGVIVNITGSGTAAVSGNSAASTAGTTDPWANFAY